MLICRSIRFEQLYWKLDTFSKVRKLFILSSLVNIINPRLQRPAAIKNELSVNYATKKRPKGQKSS